MDTRRDISLKERRNAESIFSALDSRVEISANRASPANRASLAHVIRPLLHITRDKVDAKLATTKIEQTKKLPAQSETNSLPPSLPKI